MTGRPPEECFEEGEFVGGDICKMKTGEDYGGAPPDECVEGSDFVGQEECGEIMGWGQEEGEFGSSPPECLEDHGIYVGDEECMKRIDPGCAQLGASNWDECHNIMKEKYGMSPDECFEGEGVGFIGELKCAAIINENYKSEEKENTAPDYCFDEDNEYIGDDACSAKNDEVQDEYIDDLYGEINELEGNLEDHGTAPDYCFDEDNEYIGDDACSAKNDEVQGGHDGGEERGEGSDEWEVFEDDGEGFENEIENDEPQGNFVEETEEDTIDNEEGNAGEG